MNPAFWHNKRVLITGGAGFIGSHVAEQLSVLGAVLRVADNLENGSTENISGLLDKIEFVDADLKEMNRCKEVSEGMDIIFHLAAKVGGIGFNQAYPGTMFRDNVLINTHILEAARVCRVERILMVSSACVYPRSCTIPTPESEGFVGVPEPTNEGYGWAKRMLEVQSRLYHQEFGMKIAIARPYNTYGPRDHFDPEKSHVIPAIIKRLFDGEDPLVVWGSGQQSRAFLFVTDLARGFIELIEKYPTADPVNIGCQEEIKIKDLVELAAKLSERRPKVVFNSSKPDGQPRRNCDTKKAEELIGFKAAVRIEEGLRRTIDWYSRTRVKIKNEIFGHHSNL